MMSTGQTVTVPSVPGSLADNLRLAASRGDVHAVKELLAAGASLELDKERRNALHYAAQEGHSDVCKYLAAHGCDMNLQDVVGCTPLLKATSQGAKDAVQMLLDAGCHIDVQDEHGNAAIHEACWNGFSQTAELLVKYNCNVCLMNKAGFTALHLAAQNGHNECSRVLLYAGCNPDMKNNYGDTALHTAARYGHAGVTRILISARCKISEQNKNGDTALHIAAALKRRKIAKILVEFGIDTELVNKQNEKAIDVAKRKEHPEILLIITSYSTPRPPPSHRFNGEHAGVIFKDVINSDDRLEVCQEDEPLHKLEPKVDKQHKERRFFFFKKKKKNKEKTTPMPVGSYKKPDTEHVCSGREKPAVQGFFSHYVPRDGVQFYRDLAGNIKQGPIGYAPVCQCGPSLRRLEHSITDTRESLQNRISASHHLLSQRIDNLDTRTNHQAYATEVMIKDRLQNEKDACNARITERLQEERLENQAKFDETNTGIKEELEYWLNDRLASYGHCLDHHHDDSALPPRNLFFDFPTMGRLIRSRSDETLTASDYSGKFRKKDFYASRQAAMQHIRGWDVPAVESFSNVDRSRRKERNNNNVIANSNKVVTHALVHTTENVQNSENDAFCPDKNFVTSPGNLTTHFSNTEKTGTMGRSGKLPWKQTTFETAPQKDYLNKGSSRVTFSKDQQKQHLQQAHHHPLSSSPSQVGPHSPTDQVHRSRQTFRNSSCVTSPTSQSNMRQNIASSSQHSHWTQQNLHEGGPPNTDIKSSELGDSRILLLTGQDKMYINRNTRLQIDNQRLKHCEDGYDRERTLSADSLLNEESNLSYSRDIVRCHSVENALDDDSKIATIYNSGYLTDTALRSSSAGSSARNIDNSRSIYNTHSTSPSSRATYRYRLPETSTSQDDTSFGFHGASLVNSPQQGNNISSRQATNQAQSPTYLIKFNKAVDPDKQIMAFPKFSHASREFIQPKSLHKSVNNLDDNRTGRSGPQFSISDKHNQVVYPEKSDSVSKSDRSVMSSKAHSVHFTPPKNDCLQHENLVTTNTVTSPTYAPGNKEDSTCSSNQDSGYGSRNPGQGLRRGINTSVGTPSSSFSAERSGCNTPSNADSPYVTHSELSNEGMRAYTNDYHATTTVYDNGLQFSSAVVPNKNIHSHSGGSKIDVSYTGNSYDKYSSDFRDMLYVNSNSTVPSHGNMPLGDSVSKPFDCRSQGNSFDKSSHLPPLLMSCRSTVQRDLNNYNSSRYFHTGRDSNTLLSTDKQLQSEATQNIAEKSASQRSGNSVDINERLSFQQSSQNNHSFSFKGDGNTKQPKTLREQIHKPVLPCHSDTPLFKQVQLTQNTNNNYSGSHKSEGRANSHQQNSDNTSQAEVQAHIQGWYQRKLMEAAHRLKQNNSYSQSNSHQYVPRIDSNYFQKRNVVVSTHDFHDYPSNSEKSQETFSPTTHFQAVHSAQTSSQSYLHHFQNSKTKSPCTEQQNFDRLENSGQAGLLQHKDVYPRVAPLYERNISNSNNPSHLRPADQTYHLKSEDSSTYTPGKHIVTYSTLFYDSVRGSDV